MSQNLIDIKCHLIKEGTIAKMMYLNKSYSLILCLDKFIIFQTKRSIDAEYCHFCIFFAPENVWKFGASRKFGKLQFCLIQLKKNKNKNKNPHRKIAILKTSFTNIYRDEHLDSNIDNEQQMVLKFQRSDLNYFKYVQPRD